MIQHRGPLKNFFIDRISKSKNKQVTAQTQLVLNLKRRLLYFSKRIGKKNICLKKTNMGFNKKILFLLNLLLFDFAILIKQKLIKKVRFLYKNTIKKTQNISRQTNFFIKNTVFIFLPQNNLKQ